MKKVLLLLLIGVLACVLCACGSGTDAEEPAGEEAAAEEAAEETAPAEPAVELKTDSAYAVELKDPVFMEDSEGKSVMILPYNFTNNSEETGNAAFSVYIKAFQDGIELGKALVWSDELPEDLAALNENSMKDLRPGASIDCIASFELASTSDVEVEVTELISLDNTPLAVQVYPVQ